MKSRLAILLGVISLLLHQVAVGQQFNLEWEWEGLASYVGDMDGDGIGEFAVRSDSVTTWFYDGREHYLKWTTTGVDFSYYWFQTDRNPYIVFPSIDYTGDGVREILFRPPAHDGDGIMIMDVVNDSIIFELSDPEAYNVTLRALADVDGDGELELVISKSKPDTVKTYVYSAGVTDDRVNENNLRKSLLVHKLSQNYPNPFGNSITRIEYSVRKAARVSIRVYNTAGQLIRTLVDESKKEGNHTVNWNGRDDRGNRVASGTYFYEMQIDDHRSAKKAIMLR